METHFFKSVLLILIAFSLQAFSQEKEMVKLLNKALSEDVKLDTEYDRFHESLKIISPYKLTDGVLSVELEVKGNDWHYTEKREVPLSKIRSVNKDVNLTFDTEANAVKVTEKPLGKETGKETENRTESIFFTGILNAKNNKYLGYDLQNVFAKAGYKIELGYWYD